VNRQSAKLVFCFGVLAVQIGLAQGDPYGERPQEREGFVFGLGLGPAIFRGARDFSDLQGVGGNFDLRIGTTATPRLLWLLELQGGGYLEDEETIEGSDKTYTTLSSLTLGGQLYVRDALWLRGGVGLASLAAQAGRRGAVDPDSQRGGLAAIAGGGYDAFRRGRFVLSLELLLTASAFRGGPVAHGAGLLGLAWY
jgi:hypothetical protein